MMRKRLPVCLSCAFLSALAVVLLGLGCGKVPSYDEAIVIALGDPANERGFKRMGQKFNALSAPKDSERYQNEAAWMLESFPALRESELGEDEIFAPISSPKPARVELQGAQNYEQWLAIQFIGGKPPAILNIMAKLSWLYGAHEDRLVAFDPYLDQINPMTGNPWRDQFLPGVLDVTRAPDGQIYVIPFDIVKVAFYYNKDIFEAMDLDPPETWAEFMEVCRVIDEESEDVLGHHVTPCAVGNSQPSGVVIWNLGTFLDSLYRPEIPQLDMEKPDPENPGEFLEPDGFIDSQEICRGYKLGIIDPMGPRFQVVWQVFKDWSQYWMADFNGLADTDVRPRFLQQRAAMAMDGSWWSKTLPGTLGDLGPGKQFEFGVFPLPPIHDAYPYFNHPFGSLGAVGNGLSVTNVYDEQTVEDSVELVRFFSTPPVLLEASKTLNLPTVHGYELPERYSGFRPLIDGTYPHLKFVEDWWPDAEAGKDWFAEFQGYLDGRLSKEAYMQRTNDIIMEGVERAIIKNNYDTSLW